MLYNSMASGVSVGVDTGGVDGVDTGGSSRGKSILTVTSSSSSTSTRMNRIHHVSIVRWIRRRRFVAIGGER